MFLVVSLCILHSNCVVNKFLSFSAFVLHNLLLFFFPLYVELHSLT